MVERMVVRPMDEIDFFELMRQIEERRVAFAITEADDDACRNNGSRRTVKKRAILQEIADRCREAGLEPLRANF
jgi:hypothetical protein